MIVAAVCLTVVVLAMLVTGTILGIKLGRPLPSPKSIAIAEKRRVLERDRREWLNSSSHGKAAQMKLLDDQLLKLADEEAKSPRGV